MLSHKLKPKISVKSPRQGLWCHLWPARLPNHARLGWYENEQTRSPRHKSNTCSWAENEERVQECFSRAFLEVWKATTPSSYWMSGMVLSSMTEKNTQLARQLKPKTCDQNCNFNFVCAGFLCPCQRAKCRSHQPMMQSAGHWYLQTHMRMAAVCQIPNSMQSSRAQYASSTWTFKPLTCKSL